MHLLTNYLEYSSICSAFLPKHCVRKLCILLFSKHQHAGFSLTAQDSRYTEHTKQEVRGCWKHFLTFLHERMWQFPFQCVHFIEKTAPCIFVNQGDVSIYHSLSFLYNPMFIYILRSNRSPIYYSYC